MNLFIAINDIWYVLVILFLFHQLKKQIHYFNLYYAGKWKAKSVQPKNAELFVQGKNVVS